MRENDYIYILILVKIYRIYISLKKYSGLSFIKSGMLEPDPKEPKSSPKPTHSKELRVNRTRCRTLIET